MKKITVYCPICGTENELADNNKEQFCHNCGHTLHLNQQQKEAGFITQLIPVILYVISLICLIMIFICGGQVPNLNYPMTVFLPVLGHVLIGIHAFIIARSLKKHEFDKVNLIMIAVGFGTLAIAKTVNGTIDQSPQLYKAFQYIAVVISLLLVAFYIYRIYRKNKSK